MYDDPSDRATRPQSGTTVAALMEAIAAGDRSAIWNLREIADAPVRSRLRGELRRLGARYDADDLDGMVVDAVLAVAEIAGSWRPGGAAPWSWAHHRVVGVVHRFVGTFALSLDDLGDGDRDAAVSWLSARSLVVADPDRVAVDPEDAVAHARSTLSRLVDTRRPVRVLGVLDTALSEVVSDRDAAVWLAVLGEREAGNRHPAVTVGAQFGMRADHVRKTVQRVRQRVRQASTAERYASLAALPVLSDRADHQPTAA